LSGILGAWSQIAGFLSELSPVTYANGAQVTIAVKAINTGNATVVTTPAGLGSPYANLPSGGTSHLALGIASSA